MCQVYEHDRAVVSRLVRASRAHGGCVKFLRVDRSGGVHAEIVFIFIFEVSVRLAPEVKQAEQLRETITKILSCLCDAFVRTSWEFRIVSAS